MKKIVVITLFLSINLLHSANYKLSDYTLGINNLISADKYKNKVAVLAMTKDYKASQSFAGVRFYENGQWDSIPTSFNYLGSEKSVIVNLKSQIHYDSTGALWIGGDALYRYKDGTWDCYIIDDSLKELRKYKQFCVDIFNNLWIATEIYDNKRMGESGYAGYSELLKFDGNNFKQIIYSEHNMTFSYVNMNGVMPNTITALKDGRIAIIKNTFGDTPTGENDGYYNLLFINPDESIVKYQIPTISGEKAIKIAKNVAAIYADSKGNLWFPMTITSWFYEDSSGEMASSVCCGGLSMLNNNSWIVFDDKNNLRTFWNEFDSIYYAESILNFLELDNNNYFLMSKKSIYSMGNDYILKDLDLKLIGDNSYIIRSKKTWTTDEYKYFLRFDDTSSSVGVYLLADIMDYLVFKDSIWIVTQPGIVVFPVSLGILGVEDDLVQTNELLIYPNPSGDYIKIKSIEVESNCIIYNHLGEIVEMKAKLFPNARLDIRNYPEGAYFIRLENNKQSTLLKFIKF